MYIRDGESFYEVLFSNSVLNSHEKALGTEMGEHSCGFLCDLVSGASLWIIHLKMLFGLS